MRRIAAFGTALLGAIALGCGTSQPYRNTGVANSDPIIQSGQTRVSGALSDTQVARTGDERGASDEKRAFAKRNVPDSVMLRDEVGSRYDDDVVPN